ncbi:hypothetical protein BDR04DRAFT_1035501, partial [Suillus decipiens]
MLEDIKGQYHLDPFFQKVMDSPKHFCNFGVKDGILQICLHDRVLLCILNIRVDGRCLQENIISQVHSLLVHLGVQKTLTYLRDWVWWK